MACGERRWPSEKLRKWMAPPESRASRCSGVREYAAECRAEHLPRDGLDPDPADARRSSPEVLLDEIVRQPHRLEDLRALVAADRGHAHLGHDLQQALLQGGDVVLDRRLEGQRRGEPAARLQVGDRLDGEVGVDGARAEPHEGGEMHHLARLRRLDDQGREVALLHPREVVVQRRGGEQRGDRGLLRVHLAVGDDEHRVPGVHPGLGLGAEGLEGLLQALLPFRGGEGHRDDAGAVAAHVQRAQLGDVVVGKDGMRELHLPHVLGGFLQQVLLPAHVAHQRHDEVFPVGIDGRVGDLREELLEVVVQELGPVGEHGEALVVSHGADGLLRVLHHGRDDHVDVFHGVAEHPLLLLEGGAVRADGARDLEQPLQLDAVGLQPAPVGLAPRHGRLHLVVVDDPLLRRVHQEHLARCQAALLQHVLRRDVQHARPRRPGRRGRCG